MRARVFVPALVAGLTLTGAAAAAAPLRPGAATVTSSGVDGVKVGARYVSLRHAGKIARATRGCELAGPKARASRLRAPLKGSVNLTIARPLRVDTITVTGGARAKGVGVGSRRAAVKAKFPHARFRHILGIVLARVPKADGGPFEFSLGTKGKRVDAIGIPHLAFCE
jgi:hypothetical protein